MKDHKITNRTFSKCLFTQGIYIVLAAVFLFNCLSTNSSAATFYIATMADSGNDTGNGSVDSPWATFSHAFSVMQGGDTLYIKDGVYNQQLKNPPSGNSASELTRILAVNEHEVTIDGEGTIADNPLISIDSRQFIEIIGIRAKDANAGNSYLNDVLNISNSNHITIRRSGFWNAGTYMHNLPIKLGSSSYCLFEDVWAFGRGRYVLMDFDGNHNTFRRVVVRWDSGAYSGQPNAGISIYNSHHDLIENCVAIDFNAQSTQPNHSAFSVYAHLTAPTDNRFYGNIAINNKKAAESASIVGFRSDAGSEAGMYVDNLEIKDCVFWGNDSGVSLSNIGVRVGNPVIIDHLTIGDSTVGNGLTIGSKFPGTIFKNSIVWNNAGNGIVNYGPASNLTVSYIDIGHNTDGDYSMANCSTGCVNTDPTNDGSPASLTYLPRIEKYSTLATKGESSTYIGANIKKRYEDGVITSQDLWPWPYEGWIREDMREVSKRGFCADGKTLTNYIWNFFRNAPEITTITQ